MKQYLASSGDALQSNSFVGLIMIHCFFQKEKNMDYDSWVGLVASESLDKGFMSPEQEAGLRIFYFILCMDLHELAAC